MIEFHQGDVPVLYAFGMIAPRLMFRIPLHALNHTGIHPYGLPYFDTDRYIRSVIDSFDDLRSDMLSRPYDPTSASTRDASLRSMVYESAMMVLMIGLAVSVYPVTKAYSAWTERDQKID